MHSAPLLLVSQLTLYTITTLVIADGVHRSCRSDTDLTFAENVYIRMSSACRAIMDFRYSSMTDQTKLLKTIEIIQLDSETVRTFAIEEAYVNLAKPSIYDITKQTKIVIHGYKDNAQSEVPWDLARSYNEKKMFNVLLVNAPQLLSEGYILAAHNARLVGKRLANLLANLENLGAKAEDFHLLGISLGAHIAGWAGKYFRQYKLQTLGRITGLDPAGPCFSYAYSDQRLDKMDAAYVDVIHSNRLVQGAIEPLGHADFYINGGGPNQPGCLVPSCSHLRAAQVFTESVNTPKSFVGIRCKSWKHFEENTCETEAYAVLGYGSSIKTRGLYFLRTSDNSPFGLGMDGTKNMYPVVENWLRTLM